MDLVVGVGNPLKDRFGELDRAKLTLAQFVAGIVERKLRRNSFDDLRNLEKCPVAIGRVGQ